LSRFADWLLGLPPGDVYAILAVVLALEGTGLPGVPFEPVFAASGYLIGAGRLDFGTAVAVAAAANLCGNLIGYAVGAVVARKAADGWKARVGLTPERVAGAESWFERYGGATLLVGRWFGPIRTPAILAAGFVGMAKTPYLFWSAVAALSWNAAWLFAAWKSGAAAIAAWKRWGARAALAVVALVVAVYVAWRRWPDLAARLRSLGLRRRVGGS
jgi:membrane protein DedA with SNARE-associated domain